MRMILTALASVTAIAGTAVPQDICERDRKVGPEPSVERLVIDVGLGRGDAEKRLENWLATDPRPEADARLAGYQALCGAYFRSQRFGDGVRACSNAERIREGSAANVLELQRALAIVGPSHWSSGGVTIPLRDKQYTEVRSGDARVDAVVDTGAELAVISRSAASALGARPIGGSINLGTTTKPVSGSVVVVDSLEIGDSRLKRLSALVLEDEQLAYSGLNLVIPLSAIVGLRRFAYVDNGKRLLLGDAAPGLGARRTPLYWDESGIGFALDFAGGRRGVHFDSGAARSWLFLAVTDMLSPTERSSGRPSERRIGGIGGERVENGLKFRDVTVQVAGRPWSFAEVEMAEADENGEAARIGTGLLDRFETVIFDTERMQLSVD